MKIEQNQWTENKGWEKPLGQELSGSAQLIVAFGDKKLLQDAKLIGEIKAAYRSAHLTGCSAAGEVRGTVLSDDSIVITAVHFEKTAVKHYQAEITNPAQSYVVGQNLGRSIEKKDLAHIFVLTEGINIHASELIRGVEENLSGNVKITGGLAGDGFNYKETFVAADAPAKMNTVSLTAFYGDGLEVGYSSVGGWDQFGPERIITKSDGNILYELDGRSALEVYKQYLGEHAKGLPATGLYFPLSIRSSDEQISLIRTISSIDEKAQSLTFVGDMPIGARARLMRSNCEHLLDGASMAAKNSLDMMPSKKARLAILVDCIGRRLIFKQRAEDEFEEVSDVLGKDTAITGFYSYGEIAPIGKNTKCFLHNQTMTITTFSEN